MRRALALIAAALVAASATAISATALASDHRIHKAPPPLAHSLTVDEQEWSVRPSKRVVAAGVVRFRAYDRGQDSHNLVIAGPGGVHIVISLKSGGSAPIVARLRRGTYRLYCSLYAGTPQSHYGLGMHTLLTVR
jgi:hypothetical protein